MMRPEDVASELVETACRARWDAQGSTFTGYNGDVAHTWDALATLFPAQAENHRAVERHTLAAVLPEIQAQAVKSERAKRLHAERSLREMKRAMRSLAETWDRASEGAAVFADILRREVRDAARRCAMAEEPTDG